MGLNEIHSFLQGIGEFLDDVRISIQITCFGTIGGVWDIAGINAERSNDITGIFRFKGSSARFKFDGIVCLPTGKCSSGWTEINTLVDRKILLWINSVFFQNVFKDHFRHATFSSAKNVFSFQIIPWKIRHFFTCDQKVSGALRKLREVFDDIICTLLVSINRRFTSHKANICLTGEDGGHNFIRPKTSNKSQINSFIRKIPIFNRNVLRGIEDRMGDFVQCHRDRRRIGVMIGLGSDGFSFRIRSIIIGRCRAAGW